MSLTSFIKNPRIKEAFEQYATKKRTPEEYQNASILVEDADGPQGSAGASFDYLARFHIARVLRNSKIKVHQRQWISEFVQERLYPNRIDSLIFDIGDNRRWHSYLNEAHSEARAYIAGKESLEWLAVLVQYMANTDLLIRTMMGFNSNFDASGRVARELITMIDLFDPIQLFEPKTRFILNPSFGYSEKVGGADADLIVDDRLIELKTTKRLSLTKATLMQLAGYTVLHNLGGVETEKGICTKPLSKIGVYFARHNVLIEMPIRELFPSDGYEKFKAVFEEEINVREERIQKRKGLSQMFRTSRMAGCG